MSTQEYLTQAQEREMAQEALEQNLEEAIQQGNRVNAVRLKAAVLGLEPVKLPEKTRVWQASQVPNNGSAEASRLAAFNPDHQAFMRTERETNRHGEGILRATGLVKQGEDVERASGRMLAKAAADQVGVYDTHDGYVGWRDADGDLNNVRTTPDTIDALTAALREAGYRPTEGENERVPIVLGLNPHANAETWQLQ